MPQGCPFYPRCSFRVDKCATEMPPLFKVAENHLSACWEWQNVTRSRDGASEVTA
jgi:oligopeptide/dipeptide ABC transporter ATP-binding protein